jgi:hypothetical protein
MRNPRSFKEIQIRVITEADNKTSLTESVKIDFCCLFFIHFMKDIIIYSK